MGRDSRNSSLPPSRDSPAARAKRPDLVTQALLQARGLVLVAAGSARAWKSPPPGRLMLAPRRGSARQRPVIRSGPRHP